MYRYVEGEYNNYQFKNTHLISHMVRFFYSFRLWLRVNLTHVVACHFLDSIFSAELITTYIPWQALYQVRFMVDVFPTDMH
jgi:hypothetical protein